MPTLTILYWRDIPSQVIVRHGRTKARARLPDRFQEAIDRAAMRAGRGSSDAYMADWRRSEPRPCGDDLQAEADAEAARLEAGLDEAALTALIRRHGRAGLLAAPTGSGD